MYWIKLKIYKRIIENKGKIICVIILNVIDKRLIIIILYFNKLLWLIYWYMCFYIVVKNV